MELLIGGLAIGSIYALVALGIVMVFRSTGIVNFAQGELLMLGAFAYILTAEVTDSAVLQISAAVAAGAAGGLICFAVTHFLLSRATEIGLVIGTLALLIFAQTGARLLFTDNPRRAPGWIFDGDSITAFGTTLSANSLLAFGVSTLAAAGLLLWLRFTIIGHSVRAVAEDQWRAALSGVHVKLMLSMSWAIGGALAAVGGVLLSPITGVFPTIGGQVLFSAFIAALLGGFTSLAGALVGGLAVGVIQTYAVVQVGGAFRDVIMFALLLAILIWRPTGLFRAAQIRTT